MKNLNAHPFSNKEFIIAGMWFINLLVVTGLLFTGCKKEDGPHKEITVHKGKSIQAAIDAAGSRTTIKIEPGIYKEALKINKPGISLIGLGGEKKGSVVIQNPGDEENGITVNANGDGFELKNVTVKDFEENGVFLTGVDGFELDNVSAVNNGEYGLFPVLSTNGIIKNCSATGSSDTGIYVGQSTNILVTHNWAFANVSGFEIENCSNVKVSENESYNNAGGLLVFLLPGLIVKSSSGILVEDNYVHDNNHINFATGTGFETLIPRGSGVLLVGADNVTFKQNTIRNNNFVGIATVSTLVLGALAGIPPAAFADIEPNPDGTKIIQNIVKQNGAVPPPGLPLPPADLLWDGSGTDNCWKNNTYTTSFPAALPVCM